ncbi:MAG TPA: hypothetical protein VK279_09815 [Solirubrobacteraceae bacterium]|nr:hypothetical protein [Solirubrobacteraceae bacterium]
MRVPRPAIQDLRTAIDCLPVETRVAMLEGVRANDIIVGAYTDRRGGVCPMLAAHRCGGRTNFVSFARAWDRFAKAKRTRRATERELRVLISHLEASLLGDPAADELARAIAEHRELVDGRGARPAAEPRRPGDRDRARELRDKPGWSWLRPFRRYDEYESALRHLEDEKAALARDPARRERRERRERV